MFRFLQLCVSFFSIFLSLPIPVFWPTVFSRRVWPFFYLFCFRFLMLHMHSMAILRWFMRVRWAVQQLSPCWRRHSEQCASAAFFALIGSSPPPPPNNVCDPFEGFADLWRRHFEHFESARYFFRVSRKHTARPPPSHIVRRLSFSHSPFGGAAECIAAPLLFFLFVWKV